MLVDEIEAQNITYTLSNNVTEPAVQSLLLVPFWQN